MLKQPFVKKLCLILAKSEREESTDVTEPELNDDSTSFGFVSNTNIASDGSYKITLAFGENETLRFGALERSSARSVFVRINSGLWYLWSCILIKWKDVVCIIVRREPYPPLLVLISSFLIILNDKSMKKGVS